MVINKDNFLSIIEDISGSFASAKSLEQLFEVINKNFRKILLNSYTELSLIFNRRHEVAASGELKKGDIKLYFSDENPRFFATISLLENAEWSFHFQEEEDGNHYFFVLKANEEFLGVLHIVVPASVFLSEEDRHLLTILSNIFAISLEKVLSLLRIEEDQKKHEQIITQSTDIIYTCDSSGRFTFFNPISIKVTGYSEEEILGASFLTFIRKDYRQKAAEFYRQQFEERRAVTYFEFPLISKNGVEVWLGQNVQIILDGNYIKGFQAVARDITRQKQAELALNESETKFRTFSSNAPVGIFHTDCNGNCFYVNEKWSALTGMNMEEAQGQGWVILLHPEDKEKVLGEWESLLDSKTELNLEFRFITKSKRTIWVSAKAVGLRDGNDIVTGYIGTIIDITERKEAERILKETTDKLWGIFNNSVDAIFLSDPETHLITDCNPRAIELFDASGKQELIGIPGHSLVALELTQDHFDEFDHALKNQGTWNSELKYTSFKGRDFWANFSLKLIEVNGKVIELVRLTDITEKKKMEEELIEAKMEAEASMKARENFLSVVSHEIRTPMNAILGITNLMMQENKDKHQQEMLEGMKYSADNLLVMINNILDYTKIGSGKVVFEEIDFSINDMLKGIQKSLGFKALEKNIKLKVQTDPGIPDCLNGDSLRLNQILLNLVGNALKFTESGIVEINVRLLEAKDDKNILVEFDVEDTGIGIPEDKINTIFECFTQASDETTRKYGGSGLGLSIVKGMIELQGGSIKVESVVGSGSKFTFVLPFKIGAGSILNKSFEPGELFSFKDLSILVAEDNLMNQLVVSRFLSNWNIQVEIANDGAEAVEKTSSKQYDMILMDLQMPTMDGFQATEKIRLNPNYGKTPILALTASVLLDVRSKILKAGMDDYLAKPFKPQELNARIASYMPNKVAK